MDRSPDLDAHGAGTRGAGTRATGTRATGTRGAPVVIAPVWRERTLIGLEAFLGLWAVAGAVGLASGAFDLGDAIDDVPRQSPVLAAVALLVVVAIPALVVAGAAWRGRRSARVGHPIVGWLLVAWMIVQVAFIGLVSWVQPGFVLYGLVIVVLAMPGVLPATRRWR